MTRSLGIDASATGTGLVLLEARPDDKSPAAFHEEVVKVKTKGMERCSDIAAANAAGLRQAFLISGTEPSPCSGHYLPIDSLAEVEQWLVKKG